jgi:hypothetical protein
VSTRCGVRPALNPSHYEELKSTAEKFAVSHAMSSSAVLNPLFSFPFHWHSFWTAAVPDFIAEYHQVQNDDDFVYLLLFETKSKPSVNNE